MNSWKKTMSRLLLTVRSVVLMKYRPICCEFICRESMRDLRAHVEIVNAYWTENIITRYISESYSSKTQKSKECLRKMRKSLQWHWAFPGSHGKRACHDCLYCMKCGFDEVKTHLVRVHMWRRHTRFIGTSEDLNEASNLLAYCQNQSHALCGADTLILSQMRLQAAYPRIFQVYS